MKLLLAAWILFPLFAGADPGKINCDRAQSRAAKTICLIPEVFDVDDGMSRLYLNIHAEMESKCKDKKICTQLMTDLRDAQRSWIGYRNSFCELEVVHIDDQDEQDEQFSVCLISETKRKVEELRVQQLNFRNVYGRAR